MNTASLMLCFLLASSFPEDKSLQQEFELWSQIAIVYAELNPGDMVHGLQTNQYLKELDSDFHFTETDPLLEPWMREPFETPVMEEEPAIEPWMTKTFTLRD